MMARNLGVEISNILLACYLTHETIDAVIPGARNGAQVIDN